MYAYSIEVDSMRTTIALDDELIKRAQAFTGIKEKAAIVHEALKVLVARESAKRLALLGGTEPKSRPVRRRKSRTK
jgi:Arc/MetJ family transcription regulator